MWILHFFFFYEMQDKLQDGTLTTERTQQWIKKTIRSEVAARAIFLDQVMSGHGEAYTEVQRVGVMNLVVQHGEIKADLVPETLLFDTHALALL